MTAFLIIASTFGVLVFIAWIVAWIVGSRALAARLWPFALPGLLVGYVCSLLANGFDPWSLLSLVIDLGGWWWLRPAAPRRTP